LPPILFSFINYLLKNKKPPSQLRDEGKLRGTTLIDTVYVPTHSGIN